MESSRCTDYIILFIDTAVSYRQHKSLAATLDEFEDSSKNYHYHITISYHVCMLVILAIPLHHYIPGDLFAVKPSRLQSIVPKTIWVKLIMLVTTKVSPNDYPYTTVQSGYNIT